MADEKHFVATTRIEALSDGIFAFAMTLLVLSIVLPDDPGNLNYMPNAELKELVSHEWSRFMNYAIAFLLLASFWMNHSKEFHMIRATEHKHMWINMIFLMFVALVPFTTQLAGDYSEDSVAWTMFGLNIFVLGTFLYLNWWYAGKNPNMLRESVTEEEIILGKRRGLVVPAVALLSICVGFSQPFLAGPAYVLIPLVMMLPYFRAPRSKQAGLEEIEKMEK